MLIRDRAYRIARNSRSPADHQNFRTARANASNALDSAKNRYIASRLEEAASPEAKWKELRRLRVTRSSTPSPFHYFDAATLNTHFAATVNHHLPLTENDYDYVAAQPLSTTLGRQFCLRPVNEAEVLQAVNRSSSKASGLDGIS